MKKKYKYNIYISRLGGEHTIGTISKEVAEYWLENKSADDFEEHIFSHDWDDDKEKLNKSIPKEFQIDEYWHDMDDIAHMNGAEYHSTNVAYVLDNTNPDKSKSVGIYNQGVEIGEYPLDDIPIDITEDPAVDWQEDEKNTEDRVIVYGQSFEKGGWDYETIETNEPFDIAKLKVSIAWWDGLKIINDIIYDGELYGCSGGDTTGKSMAFWIDD